MDEQLHFSERYIGPLDFSHMAKEMRTKKGLEKAILALSPEEIEGLRSILREAEEKE